MKPSVFSFTRDYHAPLEELFRRAEATLGMRIMRPQAIDFADATPLPSWIVEQRRGRIVGCICTDPIFRYSRRAVKDYLRERECFTPDLHDSLAFIAEHGQSLGEVTVFASWRPLRRRDGANLYLVVDKVSPLKRACFEVFSPEHVADQSPRMFGVYREQEKPTGLLETFFRDRL